MITQRFLNLDNAFINHIINNIDEIEKEKADKYAGLINQAPLICEISKFLIN